MRTRYGLLMCLAICFLLNIAPPSAQALGIWATSASMSTPHMYGSAIGLNDGRVLVIGGASTRATEIYDPVADRWTPTGEIENASGTAVLLPNGSVLVTGGRPPLGPHGVYASATRFDPFQNRWLPAAPMLRPRAGHVFMVLPDDRVLAAGGIDQIAAGPIRTNTTEIYDPATDQWTAGPPMTVARAGHTTTRLAAGKFLIVGGDEGGASAEIYDTATNSWTPVAPMGQARQSHTANWLPNNTVLVTGDGTAELYDPASNSWRPTAPMVTARSRASYTATFLRNGQVLVAGGSVQEGDNLRILAAAELYDWTIDRWVPTAPLRTGREGHVAVLLQNGPVLVAGGYGDGGHGPLLGGANGADLVSAERYGQASTPEQCFDETRFCAQGPFLRYWQAHGGLAINGYPISNEFVEVLEDGNAYTVQYFERVRMEYHTMNQPPYDILLGQFGRRIHPADPPASLIAGARYFAETGHNVRGRFLTYWRRKGGLAQFGYPLSEEFVETLEDGRTYTVQYFERARFEYHPENRPPYDVLLGQFGRRILGAREHINEIR